MSKQIITIGRQCGSGGHTIGKTLSERLGIPFYDKEIIELAAKESGFTKDFIEDNGEHASVSMLYNLVKNLSYSSNMRSESYYSLQDEVYFCQTRIIKELGEKGPCVIVGRCADSILEERSDVLNVFIHADMDYRVKRCVERSETSRDEAQAYIATKDKRRANHYKYYTEKNWGHSSNYHLCLDSGMLGIEKCVSIIEDIYLEGDDSNTIL